MLGTNFCDIVESLAGLGTCPGVDPLVKLASVSPKKVLRLKGKLTLLVDGLECRNRRGRVR